jgi:hypothetical protein
MFRHDAEGALTFVRTTLRSAASGETMTPRARMRASPTRFAARQLHRIVVRRI